MIEFTIYIECEAKDSNLDDIIRYADSTFQAADRNLDGYIRYADITLHFCLMEFWIMANVFRCKHFPPFINPLCWVTSFWISYKLPQLLFEPITFFLILD